MPENRKIIKSIVFSCFFWGFCIENAIHVVFFFLFFCYILGTRLFFYVFSTDFHSFFTSYVAWYSIFIHFSQDFKVFCKLRGVFMLPVGINFAVLACHLKEPRGLQNISGQSIWASWGRAGERGSKGSVRLRMVGSLQNRWFSFYRAEISWFGHVTLESLVLSKW